LAAVVPVAAELVVPVLRPAPLEVRLLLHLAADRCCCLDFVASRPAVAISAGFCPAKTFSLDFLNAILILKQYFFTLTNFIVSRTIDVRRATDQLGQLRECAGGNV
jgi:hypothetical protein